MQWALEMYCGMHGRVSLFVIDQARLKDLIIISSPLIYWIYSFVS